MKKTILVLTSLLLLVLLTSCNIDIFNQNKIYEITFNANGGQTINHIYVNDSFTEDDLDYYITTKEGFVFDGWYIDQTFEHTLGDDINSPVILYAKWLEIFTITWINENDNILSTTEVIEGEMPVYDGQIPTKAYDGSYTYEFSTWSPVITEVYEDMTYTATYTATYDVTLFDTNEIDDIFNFDFSTYIPSLNTQDYEVIDESDETDYLVSIHIFDWVDTDYVEYENELNQLFYFDEDLFYWMNGNFKIYLSKNDIENEIQITLSGSKEEDVSTWIELMQALNNVFDIDDFITLLPTMQSLTHIGLLENLSGAHVSAFSDTYNTQSAIDTYEANLLNQGWYFNQVLSDTTNENVYVYQLSESNSIAIYLNYSDDQVYFNLWTFDQSTSADELDTFVNQKSITVYEETKFNKSGLPSEGTYDVLVIPVEIKGNPFPSNYLLNLEIAFNGTPETTGWQSVSSFYETSSFGKLNLSFDIHTKYITDYSASYYESFADTEGDQYAMVEAINGLDSSIDYSQYDYNDDGVLDAVYFIYSVDFKHNDADLWWAWVYTASFGEADSINNVDGKSLEYYMWASYYFMFDDIPGNDDLIINAETYIHETGHLLGFIDLYPYEDDIYYGPLGGWDMMDWNVGDHGPVNKLLFGWLDPLIAISGTQIVTLDSYATDSDGLNSVLLIPYNSDDLNDGDAFDEYLLVMFYTPQGLYEGHLGTSISLSNAGVVIYHVDARVYNRTTFWGGYFMYDNEGYSDFFVEILEADMNDSFPSTRTSDSIQLSDILRSGSIDLSDEYAWHQGGDINVKIEIVSSFINTSSSITLSVTVA